MLDFFRKLFASISGMFTGKSDPQPDEENRAPNNKITKIQVESHEPPDKDSQQDSSSPPTVELESAAPLIPDEEPAPELLPETETSEEEILSESEPALPVFIDQPVLIETASLSTLFNRAPQDRIDAVVDELNQNLQRYKLDSPIRQSHFFAQMRQETGVWMSLDENLNYSAETLVRIFPVFRDHPDWAEKYGRTDDHSANQEKIANIAYDDQYRNRFHKLGNTNDGDGWKFRGRGLMMVTGRYNYQQFTLDHSIYWPEDPLDFEETPELLEQPKYAIRSAVHFWLDNQLYLDADRGEAQSHEINKQIVTEITRKIQGSNFSAKERQQHFLTAITLFTNNQTDIA